MNLSVAASLSLLVAVPAWGDLKTWDGRHSIDRIEVRVVYFVPRDRTPLADWNDRVGYFCRRIEQFHAREFCGQSALKTHVNPEPFRSAKTTEQLRSGDANFIFCQTMQEVDAQLRFGQGERDGFPVLLVLSDINWRPLDDFYRLRPNGGRLEFEGQIINGRHHPGAASGGARATYIADRGVGWGLVSADGWRVPYCGSDCVVYHEGVGHAIGLPHPEPGNGSVMSLAQYQGWINESWLDDEQKKRLGWMPPEKPFDRRGDLFSAFRALPDPLAPKPGEEVALRLDWPAGTRVRSSRVRIQTDPFGPWIEVAGAPAGPAPERLRIGRFDRLTPVSYRVDVDADSDRSAELWGYFQVRSEATRYPVPAGPLLDAKLIDSSRDRGQFDAADLDLLSLVDLDRDRVSGDWTLSNGRLESPKEYGARIELPYQPPAEYRLTVIAESLDEPNGLILGQRSAGNRFLVLINFVQADKPASALENIDGRNVNNNASTVHASLLKKNRPSQIICTVRKNSVTVSVDGREIIDWHGESSRLSLSDYWKTPRDSALFLGAYDCRYLFSRVTLTPISGEGKLLTRD